MDWRLSSNFHLDLPLASIALDRDYLSRTKPEFTGELLKSPQTLVLAMFENQVLLTGGTELKFSTGSEITDAKLLVYLGTDLTSNLPVLLAVIDGSCAETIESISHNWHSLRKSGAGLSPEHAAIYAQALALANWHETHKFCPACGSETSVTNAGWVRVCNLENRELFPRTDPAVIVGIVDDRDRILLGSQGVWEENRFSILAGFVEPGESLEAAVIREMKEEAGVVVANPEFLGSQAWPFPFSLMLGFTARYVSGDVLPDGEEIVKLRWFTRAELLAEADSLILPGRLSIARAIIENWLGHKLESVND